MLGYCNFEEEDQQPPLLNSTKKLLTSEPETYSTTPVPDDIKSHNNNDDDDNETIPKHPIHIEDSSALVLSTVPSARSVTLVQNVNGSSKPPIVPSSSSSTISSNTTVAESSTNASSTTSSTSTTRRILSFFPYSFSFSSRLKHRVSFPGTTATITGEKSWGFEDILSKIDAVESSFVENDDGDLVAGVRRKLSNNKRVVRTHKRGLSAGTVFPVATYSNSDDDEDDENDEDVEDHDDSLRDRHYNPHAADDTDEEYGSEEDVCYDRLGVLPSRFHKSDTYLWYHGSKEDENFGFDVDVLDEEEHEGVPEHGGAQFDGGLEPATEHKVDDDMDGLPHTLSEIPLHDGYQSDQESYCRTSQRSRDVSQTGSIYSKKKGKRSSFINTKRKGVSFSIWTNVHSNNPTRSSYYRQYPLSRNAYKKDLVTLARRCGVKITDSKIATNIKRISRELIDDDETLDSMVDIFAKMVLNGIGGLSPTCIRVLTPHLRIIGHFWIKSLFTGTLFLSTDSPSIDWVSFGYPACLEHEQMDREGFVSPDALSKIWTSISIHGAKFMPVLAVVVIKYLETSVLERFSRRVWWSLLLGNRYDDNNDTVDDNENDGDDDDVYRNQSMSLEPVSAEVMSELLTSAHELYEQLKEGVVDGGCVESDVQVVVEDASKTSIGAESLDRAVMVTKTKKKLKMIPKPFKMQHIKKQLMKKFVSSKKDDLNEEVVVARADNGQDLEVVESVNDNVVEIDEEMQAKYGEMVLLGRRQSHEGDIDFLLDISSSND